VENYFSPGNLTALRELALRRTAQRVDDQLLSHMQSHAIAGPWAAGERVLVCIDEHAARPSLVRYARRLADRCARRSWRSYRDGARRASRMPEQGPARRHPASRRATGRRGGDAARPAHRHRNRRYAAANNVTHIVIGKPRKPRWREWLQGSVSHELIRHAGDISVHVIAGTEQGAKPAAGMTHVTRPRFELVPYLWSTGYVLVALGAGLLLDRVLDVTNVALVFLMAVLAAALSFGLGAALFASLLSALCAQLLLSEAALHAQYQRSGERHRARLLPRRGVHRFQPDRAGAAAGRGGAAAGPHHRGPLFVFARSLPVPVRSTTCCGPPRTRSPRC
jgi:two-component system sensor histidine kinase KdpD